MRSVTIGVFIILGLFSLFNTISGAEVEDKAVAPKTDQTPSLQTGVNTYNRYCTPCHGLNSAGDGFNAKRLYVKPADHTDAKYMATRSDDKLFSVINQGGKGISKSTLMPPWGAAIGDVKIKSLIIKLRDLCKCSGAK